MKIESSFPQAKLMKQLFSMKSLFVGLILIQLSCNKNMATLKNSDGSYAFETVDNDPMNVQICTLSNGLKIYMSVNKTEPRIQTLITTKAGSKNDPSDATGLAHYLEHMLFKGSSKIGSLDWEKEKILLDQIADLYEQHRAAAPEDRAAIYQSIDSLSTEAAQYAVPNEYDQLVGSLGAKNTNAFTFVDRTVFMNEIPSNEVEKWFMLESERFSRLVLRMFHTELETVFEEFNMSQNNDFRKVFHAMMQGLLPNHPYGNQTTIGTGAHLKTPSMDKIYEFFAKYYVPNNMAIILSGDFEPNEIAAMAEKYFGSYKKKRIPKAKSYKKDIVESVVEKEVLGPEKAAVQIGFKLPGGASDEALLAQLCVAMLYNQKAGLIDVNLVQNQVLGPQTAADFLAATDYSFIFMYGEPRAGMSLQQAKEYLMKEIERLATGQYEDWLPEAVVNNMEIATIQNNESNSGRAFAMLEAFIMEKKWSSVCTKFEKMRQFTKADITAFVQNYLDPKKAVIVYKNEGEDSNIEYVDKPPITPLDIDRAQISEYARSFNKIKSAEQQASFVDYNDHIIQDSLHPQVSFDYIKNSKNKTFELVYIFEMGKQHDNILPIAFKYLHYLSTDQYSLSQLQQQFFKLGLSFETTVQDDALYVSLSGLERSLEEGIVLMEHLLSNAVGDGAILKEMVADIIKNRQDQKKDKQFILKRAMLSYAYYGYNSPFKSRLDASILEVLQPKDLMKYIHGLHQYPHRIFYYGSKRQQEVKALLNSHHKIPQYFKSELNKHRYIQKNIPDNQVLFVHFEGMSQAEVLTVSKISEGFDLKRHADARLYNEYFGYGLSSVVFQEIRESKALAYSAYAYYISPENKDKAHYLTSYVGTQNDKLKEAIMSMNSIMQDIPVDAAMVHKTAAAILKKMKSERLDGADIYWDKRANQRRGFEINIQKNIFDSYAQYVLKEENAVQVLEQFHQSNVKDKPKMYLVLGDREEIDINFLRQLGNYQELSLKELFGY